MKGVKLPATIRWAITNCLLLWFCMTLYRCFLIGVFMDFNPTGLLAIFSGMLTDAGLMAIVLVIYVFISLLPALHPFKSRKGKFFGYIYFILCGLMLSLAYALDLIFVKAVHFRMYGSKMLEILGNTDETNGFFRQFSINQVLMVTLLLLWIWAIIIIKLHKYISRLSRVHDKSKWITWNVAVVIIGLLWGGLALKQGLEVKMPDLDLKAAPYLSLRSNPVFCFFLV